MWTPVYTAVGGCAANGGDTGSGSGGSGSEEPESEDDGCTADETAGQILEATKFGPGEGMADDSFERGNGAQMAISMCSPGDIDGNGVTDLVIGAWQAKGGGNKLGSIIVVLLNDDMSVKAYKKLDPGTAELPVTVRDGGRIGKAVAGVGDLDGDGVVDFITSEDEDGILDIVFLKADGSAKSVTTISGPYPSGYNPEGSGNGDYGRAMASAGDLDGDGVVDIAVGAPIAPGGGQVRLLFLNKDGSIKQDALVSAPTGASLFGLSVARVGDVDGDGVAELAMGSISKSAVYIVFLDKEAGWTAKRVSTINISEGKVGGGGVDVAVPGKQFARAVAEVGDVNGDGVPDLWVGSVLMDTTGSAHIFLLNADGLVTSVVESKAEGLPAGAWFGSSAALVGGVAGEGIGFAVGAGNSDAGVGSVYLVKCEYPPPTLLIIPPTTTSRCWATSHH